MGRDHFWRIKDNEGEKIIVYTEKKNFKNKSRARLMAEYTAKKSDKIYARQYIGLADSKEIKNLINELELGSKDEWKEPRKKRKK